MFAPNDTLTPEVASVKTEHNDRGVCEADFVVLEESELPPITDGP